ncbi:hypothetical protein PoB_002689900 [Plakobranchus ocellatus]|uniref:Uncharacterized protein n=1 Tax=Plakobranchus ocellatus TaxID=259542 RepID=A0AAV3ZYJ6_9GAST|nr:hypothetical protein PoB_002689900 [Plakobranchus ocellatus]
MKEAGHQRNATVGVGLHTDGYVLQASRPLWTGSVAASRGSASHRLYLGSCHWTCIFLDLVIFISDLEPQTNNSLSACSTPRLLVISDTVPENVYKTLRD